MTDRLPTVGIAGLTHLGLNTAAAIADRGFDTVCFDVDTATVTALRDGQLPVYEPDLQALLASNSGRITFADGLSALAACDVVYIATDVPTDDTGASDLSEIEKLIELVSGALSPQAVLVVLCQVPPGFTRRIPYPDPDRLYYQVETLVFGRAVERACHPERYIVGCAEPGNALPEAFHKVLAAFDCPILPMRYESAELVKISINLCLVASISVANSVAEVCERIGADWSEMSPALRLDRRIGPHAYLDPGLGIAGGNLERDLATIIRLAEAHGTDAGVIESWVANSRHRKGWAWQTLSAELLPRIARPRIAVLGLAYKKDTHSTKNSPALALLSRLAGHDVVVYDPVVPASAAGPEFTAADSALAAAQGADVVAIMTQWDAFADLVPEALARAMRGSLLLDPFGMIDGEAAQRAGLEHHRLGRPALPCPQATDGDTP
jgi:UDPglucose 6-dehydrogenase